MEDPTLSVQDKRKREHERECGEGRGLADFVLSEPAVCFLRSEAAARSMSQTRRVVESEIMTLRSE